MRTNFLESVLSSSTKILLLSIILFAFVFIQRPLALAFDPQLEGPFVSYVDKERGRVPAVIKGIKRSKEGEVVSVVIQRPFDMKLVTIPKETNEYGSMRASTTAKEMYVQWETAQSLCDITAEAFPPDALLKMFLEDAQALAQYQKSFSMIDDDGIIHLELVQSGSAEVEVEEEGAITESTPDELLQKDRRALMSAIYHDLTLFSKDKEEIETHYQMLKRKILVYLKKLGLASNPAFHFDDKKRIISIYMDPTTLDAFNFRNVDSQLAGSLERNQSVYKLESNTKELIREAQAVYGDPKYSRREFRYTEGLQGLADRSPASILRHFFEKSSEVIVGESHHSISSKRFLIEQMPYLKEIGASLALEHVLYHPYQEFLDRYIEGKDVEMNPLLRLYLQRLDSGFRIPDPDFGFLALVKAAKEHGVRVIAAETATSYRAGFDFYFGSGGTERMWGLNYTASKIIDKEAPGKKVVYLVGSAHANVYETGDKRVPGLSEIRGGIPSMVIMDSEQDSKINIQETLQEGKFHQRNVAITPDVTIHQKVAEK